MRFSPLAIAFALTTTAAGALAAPAVKVGRCLNLDQLEETKSAGFDYGEISVSEVANLSDEDFTKLLARARSVGLPLPVANRFLPKTIKVVGPEIDQPKVDEYLRKALERVSKLGVKIVVFGSGASRDVPDGFSRDEAWTQLVAFGKRAAVEAKKRGIVIAVEPLRKQETDIVNTAGEGLKLAKAINHPSFQLMVDFYHLASEKEDPQILLDAKKEIRHFHVANPNGRVFPVSADEYDYKTFFENVRKMGFKGGMSVEASTKDFAGTAPKTLGFLRAALK